MKANLRAQDVRLVGPPRNARGRLKADVTRSAIVPISLRLANEDAIFRARLKSVGRGLGELRLRLPHQTPPGVYSGRARLGEAELMVSVQVEPANAIRMHPSESVLSGPPGGTVSFELTVANGGNVPVVVLKVHEFDLDDEKGQEGALGRTSRAVLADGEGRADRFFEELRQDHGGIGRVTVTHGAGPLDGGTSRPLKCRLAIPDDAQEGRTFLGAWGVGLATHGIVLDVTRPGPPRRRKQ